MTARKICGSIPMMCRQLNNLDNDFDSASSPPFLRPEKLEPIVVLHARYSSNNDAMCCAKRVEI